ncbi:MAG TPA: aminotransferase class III-fold pyridoxal phosphate-dependent enzyme, partial [Propionibacteriaceae bacterium]|nr:aminotransferase class III-fold pyridoxal phosphate-dependent enzyme [Propionibacteriaceae bacterium]
EDLAGRARRIEEIVREELGSLVGRVVGELRGRGAMMALEFVKPGTLEPNPDAVKAVIASSFAQGVVLLSCGTYGNNIRLLPPLVIDEGLLREGLGVLRTAIEELS